MAGRFEDILQSVVRDAGAEGAVLVSPDGLAIASVLPEGIDEEKGLLQN